MTQEYKMIELVEECKMKFVAFTPIFKTVGGEVTKTYPPLLKDWNKKSHVTLMNHYKAVGKNEKFLLINCTNDYIIFDTDTKEDCDKLENILGELDIFGSNSITQSSRGDKYSYKCHFWFAVDEDEFQEMKKHKFGTMEVFIGSNCSIAERVETCPHDFYTLTFDMYNKIKNAFVEPVEEVEEEKEETEEEEEEEEEKILLLSKIEKWIYDNYNISANRKDLIQSKNLLNTYIEEHSTINFTVCISYLLFLKGMEKIPRIQIKGRKYYLLIKKVK